MRRILFTETDFNSLPNPPVIITVTNETVPVVYQSINSTIVRDINTDLKLYYLGTTGIEITEINQTIAP